MKNFDLNAYGVMEMSLSEMIEIDGGNIFKDALDWIEGFWSEHGGDILQAVIIAAVCALL